MEAATILAFQQTSDGPGIISDFIDLTVHIAIIQRRF
jgi:hypothetical protein